MVADVNNPHMCEFQITERELRLRELARQYNERCEAFDQMVCSGKTDNGVAMPATYVELGAVNRNANAVKRELFLGTSFSREEISRAIRDTAR